MKFYSEVLDEIFDSEKECIEAELKKKTEAEEKRKAAEEKRRFEAEKAFAKANLEKKIEALNKELVEYIKKYEKENLWLADFAEAILESPSQGKKRPAATPITSNEFEKILEGFLN